jgi:hypothetical protein
LAASCHFPSGAVHGVEKKSPNCRGAAVGASNSLIVMELHH